MWPKYDKPFFFHFRDMQTFSAVTVCMQPEAPDSKKFRAGLACCSSIDNFSKKIGRNISEGRANLGNTTIEAKDLQDLKTKAHQMAKMAEQVYASQRQKQ